MMRHPTLPPIIGNYERATRPVDQGPQRFRRILRIVVSSTLLTFVANTCWAADAVVGNDDDPVTGYTMQTIEGWTVQVSDELSRDQSETTQQALELLKAQLITVRDILPAPALARMKHVTIWLSPTYPGFRPTGEYHPNAEWLRDNGRRPELHRSIEFTNTAIFAREIKRMPMLVLHELAHAYHDQVTGFDEPRIKAAFAAAVNAGTYEAVRRSNGNTERAYAITNHKEYFAELSEAYFGVNDFFPFNRSELELHDPQMATLLPRVWGVETNR